MKKIISVLLSICVLTSLWMPMVSFAEDPTPLFEENFETKPAGDADSAWFRNETYVGTNGTLGGQTIGYGDNYPGAAFKETEVGYMWTTDPVDSSNHVLNTGKYNTDKRIIARYLPEDCANKIVEVNTYFDLTSPAHTCEYYLKVGEVKINVNGWSLDADVNNSETGFSYKVQTGAQTAIKWKNTVDGIATDLHYAGTTIDMSASDGWHQFVFDYSEAGKATVYLNGVKIISTDIDTAINGTYNRANGTYVAVGDGNDNDGVRNYYIDDIRVWNTADLEYVLGLHTAPTSYHVANKPIYENTFEQGFGFGNWCSLLSRTSRWRMTNTDKEAAIAADPENSDNYVLKTNATSSDYPLMVTLPSAQKNKLIEVWFYDDPEIWTATKDGTAVTGVVNSGIYVGGSSLEGNNSGYGDAYFMGVYSQLNDYSEGKNNNYSIKFPGGVFTNTGIARTKGWHQFVIDLSVPNEQTLYIDGAAYANKGNKEGDIDCYNIWFGELFSDGLKASMYFDDLRVWNNIGEMHNGRNGEVILRDIDFTDEDGNEITSLTEGATVKTLVKYVCAQADKKARVIIAMYKDEELVDVSTGAADSSLAQKWGKVNYLTSDAEIELPDDLTGIKLKLFVFDTMSGLKPLAEITELPVSVE